MLRKTLDDGTVVIAYYDEGIYMHVYCACADDDTDPICLNENDEQVCPGCGKRYSTMFEPTVRFEINGSYETSF